MCLDLRLMGWSNQERDIIMNFFFQGSVVASSVDEFKDKEIRDRVNLN